MSSYNFVLRAAKIFAVAALLLVVTLSLALSALAAGDRPYHLAAPVGGAVKLCKTGTIVCPATAPIAGSPPGLARRPPPTAAPRRAATTAGGRPGSR